jgi:hypothetical protein
MFLTQREEAVPLLIHALKHRIEPVFVQDLLRELGEAARPALSELLGHADPEVRRYAQELLPAASPQPLATATAAAPSDAKHVTCFGDFQVTYRGQEVGEPGWLSTKAGDLFAYFITFRAQGSRAGGVVARDEARPQQRRLPYGVVQDAPHVARQWRAG